MSSSRSYYERRSACAMIAQALMKTPGWEVKGYQKDTSDISTDYFNPASWDGFAIGPEGFILVSGQRYRFEAGEPTCMAPKGATWALFSPAGLMVAQGRCAKTLDRVEYGRGGEREALVAAEIAKMTAAIRKCVGAALGEPRKPTEPVTGTTVTRNEERDGIEVRFPGKPSEEVRGWLKANGFRWSVAQGLWYARYDEALMAAIAALVTPVAASAAGSAPPCPEHGAACFTPEAKHKPAPTPQVPSPWSPHGNPQHPSRLKELDNGEIPEDREGVYPALRVVR